MGPGDSPNTVPLRQQLSCNLQAVPWIDRIGDQAQYAIAVEDCSSFHNNLPNTNRNKMLPRNRGVVLLTHLYGNAQEHCRAVRSKILAADDGYLLVVNV